MVSQNSALHIVGQNGGEFREPASPAASRKGFFTEGNEGNKVGKTTDH